MEIYLIKYSNDYFTSQFIYLGEIFSILSENQKNKFTTCWENILSSKYNLKYICPLCQKFLKYIIR